MDHIVLPVNPPDMTPPSGYVGLFIDQATGNLVRKDADGNMVEVGSGATDSLIPISEKITQTTDLTLSASHDGKLIEFSGGQNLTLPAPIVGLRCWITLDIGANAINFVGEYPRIGQGLASTTMEEGYGTAELEGCSEYWLLKQVSTHKHVAGDLDATATASDTCGGKVVLYNLAGQVSSYGWFNLVYGNYNIGITLTNLTANRQHIHPDRDGYVAVVPGYADASAANAAISVGEAWFDYTAKKVKVRMS